MQYRAVHESTLSVVPDAGPGPREKGPDGYCDGECRSRLECGDDEMNEATQEEREERRAWVLYDHFTRVHPILDRDEITSIATEALEVFRLLADKDPTKYEPSLSDILNHYAAFLSVLGDYADAARIGAEAVVIRRRLVARVSGRFDGHLASSLCNLARYFAFLMRMEDAIPPVLESLDIRRVLANQEPAYEPLLAESMHHYALYLLHVDKYEEALAPAHEAVGIRSRLAEGDPAYHTHQIAWSLFRLSECYYSLDRYTDAIPVIVQAIELQRRLISQSLTPSAFHSLLAESLFHHACCLSESNMVEESLEPGVEAMVLRRGLAATRPKEIHSYVASIIKLAEDLARCDRRSAVELLDALLIYASRKLSTQNPNAHASTLAHCLYQRSLSFSNNGWHDDALEPGEEAVSIRQKLAKKNPTAYEPTLADSLYQYAFDLSRAGRDEDAIEPATQALEIRVRLASADMATYEEDLARTYYRLASCLGSCDRNAEAIQYYEGAIDIQRRLVQRNPQKVSDLSALRRSIENYGISLSDIGRHRDAIEPEKEAVDICRRLVALDPDEFEERLARTLYMMAFDLNYCDRNEEAAEAVKEVIAIRRRLVLNDYDQYIDDLADALNQNAWYLIHCPGCAHEAAQDAKEAVEIYRKTLDGTLSRLEGLVNSLDTEAQSLFLLERYQEALSLIEEALMRYPHLVSEGDDGQFDYVGSALNQTYGKVLWKLGRGAEAVEPLQEAARIYQRLLQGPSQERYERRLEECIDLVKVLTGWSETSYPPRARVSKRTWFGFRAREVPT
ncbi:TPR-like protein [Coprinopsis marcescibilis]|uniref:TPR-like protein n=1 Tax=Coprinopsis marcescibilis TaxID=230819 RepID=A0A5C3KNT9_COPMA|nr:TPR-like protein [Coprinopsis marcescibilis]